MSKVSVSVSQFSVDLNRCRVGLSCFLGHLHLSTQKKEAKEWSQNYGQSFQNCNFTMPAAADLADCTVGLP